MNVLLADDHELYREGLELFLESFLDMPSFQHAAGWFDVHQLLEYEKIDLALLDLTMDEGYVWEEELKHIIRSYPETRICVVSANDNPQVIQGALKLGARGYIPKHLGKKGMELALKQVIDGYTYVPDQLWGTFGNREQGESRSTLLTWRQQQILKVLAEGRSNKEISTLLGLSEHTVKRHIYNIFKVLGVKNRLEAVQVSRSRGLLSA